MGKNLQHIHSDVSIQNSHPGCMWSIFHLLKYHHWRHIKQNRHHKSGSNGNKHAKGDGNLGNNVTTFKAGGIPQQKNAEKDQSLVTGKKTESPRGSVKSRIKSLISDELSKRKGRHSRSSSYPVRSPLMRIDAYHRMELLDEYAFSDTMSNDASPKIAEDENSSTISSLDSSVPKSFEDHNRQDGQYRADEIEKELNEHHSFQENSDNKRQNSIHVKNFSMDSSTQQSKEMFDTLDMINIDKDFFLKILHDPNSPLSHHFQNQQVLSTKMGYSASFPLQRSLRRTASDARKGKQKQEGIEVSQAGRQTQKTIEPMYRAYARSNSIPPIAAAANSSLGSPAHMKNHGRNHNHFKNLKHKIKHAIRESKNEKHRITMDAIFHKVPHGHRFSKDLKMISFDTIKDHSTSRDGKESPISSFGSDYSLPSTSKSESRCISRTVSFSESLDRYCRLYDSSVNREAKHHSSQTLKMKAEDVVSPLMSSSKYMGRIFSLPDLKSYPYGNEDPWDFFSSGGHPVASESFSQLDTKDHVEKDILDNLDNESDSIIGYQLETKAACNAEPYAKGILIIDEESNRMAADRASTDKQDFQSSTDETSIETTEPSVLPVDTLSLENISVPEDLESSTAHLLPPKLDSFEDQLAECSSIDNETQQFHVDAKDKAEFDYVKDILTLSGFTGNDLLGTWNSDDQPVHPSVFEQVKGCVPLDPECCGNEEEGGGYCHHHLLLFDLVNEVLIEIYAKSYTYYPSPLSSLSRIHPTPVGGHHVLEEVWGNISWHLSSCADDDDQLLDNVLSRDLAKSDGWMNLQFDTECVGLELEDLIFDDLLEEIIGN